MHDHFLWTIFNDRITHLIDNTSDWREGSVVDGGDTHLPSMIIVT